MSCRELRRLEEELTLMCTQTYLQLTTSESRVVPNRRKIKEIMLSKLQVLKSEIYSLSYPKESLILDLGCGVSPTSLYAAYLGFNVISLDSNEYALRCLKSIAKKYDLHERMDFIRGDFESLPFTDKSIDVTLAFDTLISRIGLDLMVVDEVEENLRERILREQRKILEEQIEKGLSRKYIKDYESSKYQVCIPYSLEAFNETRRVTKKAVVLGVSCSDPFCNFMKNVKKLGIKAGFDSYSGVRPIDSCFKYMIME
jgi:SAM-dependent methyltransferase